MSSVAISPLNMRSKVFVLCMAPAVLIFVSSNLVNVGNLAFNMIFSRLMGPEMYGVLALILTIKLAILGVLGALQMAVSKMVAATPTSDAPSAEHALSRINRLIFSGLILMGLPLTMVLVLSETVGVRLGSLPPHLLLMLLASIPFGASFSILRGFVFGRMMTKQIIVSANVEMGVRLVGALFAWVLGFGIEGVVAAISLSIVAGWAVLVDLLPRCSTRIDTRKTVKTLAIAAAPFGLLQLAQVIALDGDVFIANASLAANEAGYIAVLSLFQRIQFFACFALAGVLLPGVVIAARDNKSLTAAAFPIFGLFAAVSCLMLLGATFAPVALIELMVGRAYMAAAAGLIFAVASAVFFTINYLAATFLAALNNKTGVLLVCSIAAAQITAMGLVDTSDYLDLLRLKVRFQAGGAVLLGTYVFFHLKTRIQ